MWQNPMLRGIPTPRPGRTESVGPAARAVGNRNWLVAAVMVAAVIVAGAIFHKSKQAESAQAPTVQFGPRVRPAASASLLDYTNSWVATSGGQAIGVYAGSLASNHTDGLFVIVRTSGDRSRTTQKLLHGSGAVTLLRPPLVKSQAAALSATLRFVAASGNTGTLNLSNDTVRFDS